ncbi:MAG: DNA glycosylase [Clostridium sp.]|uniref:DNA-3-methyladenine glycosylase family protein n=1 Tax=Clostridium sp. TaxID=1506 RepID=UPI00290697F1|nr:DNA glycosylase [Clostridium sp.]MDU7338160.1 DNA glycosylase [Clostridium sp.]
MHYIENMRGIEILSSTDLDLQQTLDCGQCFRWQVLPDGEYRGIAFGRKLTITEKNGTVLFHGVTAAEFESIWIPYFDLNFDYAVVRELFAQMHPALKEAATFAPGIRLLQQDPWEALCSFILSQNNNIPRIKGLVDRLCQLLGEERDGFHDFPTPERLAEQTIDTLAPVRSGFRAKYLIDAAQKVCDGTVDLNALYHLPMEEARQSLTQIYGVGDKVAECALLYGFHRLEAFPMDVWMKRAMAVLLPGYTPEQLGPYAGIAQQYLFHYSRCNAELFTA